MYSKGAPDVMIDYCKRFINRNGQIEVIKEEFFSDLKEKQKKFANDSLRTLLIAFKEINPSKDNSIPSDSELESDLIVLCMVGIQDPLRPNIAKSVKTC